jgi:nucleoside phosphorylase
MKYELPNIFLHFLEKDTQEILGINEWNKSSMADMQIALNTAVLLCKEYCILPIGSYFESECTKRIILNNLEYYRDGLIVFAMREDEIEEYQIKKQDQYKGFINDVAYSRYFDKSEIAESKELFRINTRSLRRTTKIGEYCLLRWNENLSLFIDNNGGMISNIYNLDNRTPGENAINVASNFREKAKQIERGAFIWRTMSEELSKISQRDYDFERRARRLFQHSYFGAYIDEFGASILHDYLPFERNDLFMLKRKCLSASNYKWFKEYLSCLNLDLILSCSGNKIIKIKRIPEFERLIKIYLEICNDDRFSNQTSFIRTAVSEIMLSEGSLIKDLVNTVIAEITKMNDVKPTTYTINSKSIIDVLIIIATQDEENALLSINEWKKVKLRDEIDYFHTVMHNLSIALVRGTNMGQTSASIIGQAAIYELSPKYIAMVGFCAGQQGKVQLGDIVVADKVYNYEGGKRTGEKETLPVIDSFNLHLPWIQKVERFGDEWRKNYDIKSPPSYEMQKHTIISRINKYNNKPFNPWEIGTKEELPNLKEILTDMLNDGLLVYEDCDLKRTDKGTIELTKFLREYEWSGSDNEPKTKIGAIATGAKVQQWSGIFNVLTEQYDRKTIALDMESYAIAELAETNKRLPWIIAKGVGDYAKDGKALNNSLFVPFGCITSFYFVIEFLSFINNEREQLQM